MWYVWHGCIKKQRDILSVVIVLAIPRPLDYSWLFVACSAISAMWDLAWGLVCKELHMLELHFLFSVPPLSRCTERINSMASEFISPSLHCSVFCLHMWTLAWHSAVFPWRINQECSAFAAINSVFAFLLTISYHLLSLFNSNWKLCTK